jgi:hypothetical protein
VTCLHGEIRIAAIVGDHANPDAVPNLLTPDDLSPWSGMAAHVEIGECRSCASVLTRVAAFATADPERRWGSGWVLLTPPPADPGPDPLRTRAIAAVEGYRRTGADEHLRLLRMDALPQLAHDLTLERRAGDRAAGGRVDEWLAATPNAAP